MMYFLLGISIVFAVLKTSLYNNYAKTARPEMVNILTFNAISYAIAAIVALCMGIEKTLSWETLVLAFFYAVDVCALQSLSVYAMKLGSMSTTSLISLYGMIIPSIAGPIFWKERFVFVQLVGIFLVLLSMWLLKKEEAHNKIADKKWAGMATIVFFLSGFAGLIEKIHQTSDGRYEKTTFLFTAYLIMFLFSTISVFVLKKRNTKTTEFKSVFLHSSISGIIIGFYAFINLTLAGKLDSMIYYPVANGGALLLTVIIAIVFFKEKCTKRHMLGFIIGFLSILLLSLPI